MTIDEVIKEYREEAEGQRRAAKSLNCIELDFYAEKNEQIAEWLEELKAFRENKWTLIWKERGYNKAIDDFAGQLKWEYKSALSLPSIEKETAYFAIDKVAEQLKLKHLEKESEE